MAGELPAVALIYGDEALLVRREVEALVEAAVDPALRSLNLAEYRAAEAEGALSVARTQPMMARRRAVVVRELERAPVALLDALLDYVKHPNPSTVLVLTGAKLPPAAGGVDRGRRLANAVKKLEAGLVKRLRAGDVRPETFAAEHARAAGCELDPRAARLLVELVGTDLGTLAGELDKAIAWLGGEGRIDAEVVATVSSAVAEAEIWDLTNALAGGDADASLAALFRLLEEGGAGEAHRLLGLVTWQVRQLLVLQSAMRSRGPLPDSWKRVPRRHREASERALRARPLAPARVLGALARANRAFNRSRAGARRVLEGLVLELTA